MARVYGRPTGIILIHPYGCAGSPYIASVAVAENARAKGVGSQLLAFGRSASRTSIARADTCLPAAVHWIAFCEQE